MSDYTPTTELMREWYVRWDHSGDRSREEYEAEFDRWRKQERANAVHDFISGISAHIEDHISINALWHLIPDYINRHVGGSENDA